MGIQDLSRQTNHLIRRSGIWYYRRRVPAAQQAALGKKEIQLSLGTSDLKEAKKRRAVEDLKWATRFESDINCTGVPNSASNLAMATPTQTTHSEGEIIRLVQDYVAGADERARRRLVLDPPDSVDQKLEIASDIEMGISILKNPDDPRAAEYVDQVGGAILKGAGGAAQGGMLLDAMFAGFVRRGLLELHRRKLAVLDDDHSQVFFDQAFDPARKPKVTFGELADQMIQIALADAAANGTSIKWVDKQRANFAFLKEVIGAGTPVSAIDYDICLRVRTALDRVPAGRTKTYSGLSLEEAQSYGVGLKTPPGFLQLRRISI